MKDEAFIQSILQRGQEAKQKVLKEFSDITETQFNWKSSTKSWSIAECLEHLYISDNAYFEDLRQITSGSYEMNFWEKYSPLTAFWGKTLKDQLSEQVKKKMVAPKLLTPTSSSQPLSFRATYLQNLDTFLDYIARCNDVDIDKTVITSPTVKIATYNLRDAFEFLINHEHRHINQAIKVKGSAGFQG